MVCRLTPLIAVALAGVACRRTAPPAPQPSPPPVAATAGPPRPAFTGSAACLKCHGKHGPRWSASWHARALAPATATSVVGRFENVHFRGSSTEASLHVSGGGETRCAPSGRPGPWSSCPSTG